MSENKAKSGLKAPNLMMVLGIYLWLLVTSANFHGGSSAFFSRRSSQPQKFGSSVVFPISGNVYPHGYYYATLSVGQPPRPYFLDIDTGSDLTWLQCDAPCTKCTPAPHRLYKPHGNLITCSDPICTSLHGPGNHPCENPEEQCDYEVEYADHGSSMGVLVKDVFPLKLTNGSTLSPRLAFGCGYNQEVLDSSRQPLTDGVLGLGGGKSSIVAQLQDLGLVRNVIGHCLSSRGGGFLFFGDQLVPSSGIAWTPLLHKSTDRKHYSLGRADILFGGQKAVRDISIVFDSGSTYTYFGSQVYNALVSMIKKDLNEKQLKDAAADNTLPVCWKGPKPFKSVFDAKSYFKPIVLSFNNAKNVRLRLEPDAYLIATKQGSVCLGILDGSEVGLGNFNIIGDISMQDKMVIYDHKKGQIGWVQADCDRLPNVCRGDRGGTDWPYAASKGIFGELLSSKFLSEKMETSK